MRLFKSKGQDQLRWWTPVISPLLRRMGGGHRARRQPGRWIKALYLVGLYSHLNGFYPCSLSPLWCLTDQRLQRYSAGGQDGKEQLAYSKVKMWIMILLAQCRLLQPSEERRHFRLKESGLWRATPLHVWGQTRHWAHWFTVLQMWSHLPVWDFSSFTSLNKKTEISGILAGWVWTLDKFIWVEECGELPNSTNLSDSQVRFCF